MHAGLDERRARHRVGGNWSPRTSTRTCTAPSKRALIAIVGPELGGQLRAGRSRNDQIATLIRMYLLDHAVAIGDLVVDLIDAVAAQAETHEHAIMPGRTHLQHAQPVLLAHHLLAHAWPLVRDLERLRDWRVRASTSPYGAGALAGIEPRPRPRPRRRRTRARPARAENSIDATASRDVVAEFAYIAAQLGIDLSRLAEEIILWNTREFGFVRPRRRLLDRLVDHAAEEEPRHRRARARQVRSPDRQPHGAARDAQGPAARLQPRPAGGQGAGLRLGRDARGAAAGLHGHDRDAASSTPNGWPSSRPQGFSLATDVADWLVRRQVPFREAHEISGALVRFCEEHGLELHEPSDEQYASVSPLPHRRGARGAHRRRAPSPRAPARAAPHRERVAEQRAELTARIRALTTRSTA